ncbi:hypothetical protein BC827DRAFT_719060 [Russula dissimulans]|nr:hypothetical protein BC827DRAFT_719060 [Russula dissimulans]
MAPNIVALFFSCVSAPNLNAIMIPPPGLRVMDSMSQALYQHRMTQNMTQLEWLVFKSTQRRLDTKRVREVCMITRATSL